MGRKGDNFLFYVHVVRYLDAVKGYRVLIYKNPEYAEEVYKKLEGRGRSHLSLNKERYLVKKHSSWYAGAEWMDSEEKK